MPSLLVRRSCLLTAALSVANLAEGFQFVRVASLQSQTGLARSTRWAAPASTTSVAARRSNLPVPLKAVSQDATSKTAPILVTGNNVEVTEPLQEYIEKKMVKVLEKLGSTVSKVDVHLSVNKNPRVKENHNAEVTVFAKSHVIRATDTSDNMYACVDSVTDRIQRKLRRFKGRNISEKRSRPGLGEASKEEPETSDPSDPATEETDNFKDDYGEAEVEVDMSLVKNKSFPMPAINVDEAVMCLDYIDHDFYLFRNAETNEVNVVYKRNHGGVGHIQPEAAK